MWAFHSSSPSSPSPSPSSPHTQTDAHEMYQLGKQKCVIMVNQYNISQFLFSFCISMCISVWKYEFFFVNVCLLCLFFFTKKNRYYPVLTLEGMRGQLFFLIYFFIYFVFIYIFILFFLYISMCSSLDYSLRPSTHLAEHWHSQSQTSFFFNFLFSFFSFFLFFFFLKKFWQRCLL